MILNRCTASTIINSLKTTIIQMSSNNYTPTLVFDKSISVEQQSLVNERNLINGNSVTVPDVLRGSAVKSRGGNYKRTEQQLRFVVSCMSIGEANKSEKMSALEAHRLMKVIGTPAGYDIRKDSFTATSLDGRPQFKMIDVLDIGQIKSYFSRKILDVQKELTHMQNNKAPRQIDNDDQDYGKKLACMRVENMRMLLKNKLNLNDIDLKNMKKTELSALFISIWKDDDPSFGNIINPIATATEEAQNSSDDEICSSDESDDNL